MIQVADSEADIYELLVAGQFPETQNEPSTEETGAPPAHAEWIVRGCQNRAVLPAPLNWKLTWIGRKPEPIH